MTQSMQRSGVDRRSASRSGSSADEQDGHNQPGRGAVAVAGTALAARRERSRRAGRGAVAAWERRYRILVIASDVLAIALVMSGAVLLAGKTYQAGVFVPATAGVVLAGLAVSRAWQLSILGYGAEEFRRLGRGLFTAAVVLGFLGLAFGKNTVGAEAFRPWVFGTIPAVAVLAFPLRYLVRRGLHHSRNAGRCLLPVIAAGRPDTVADLIARTRSAPHIGWRIDAVCTATGTGGFFGGDGPADSVAEVPVVGDFTQLASRIRDGGYRFVAVTPDPYWTPNRLQRLAWELEGTAAEMVVAPVLMEVAGPRLHVSGVFGVPLVRVSAPAFTGATRVVKGVVDKVGSALLLLALSPLLLAVAAAIKLSDSGPVIYRQERVGKDGAPFTMFKFRTMVVGADRLRTQLAISNEGAGPLFKLRADPRVTRVGRLLRRYSLDELPQLLNVLLGSMSLVGPRPPLREETEQYEDHVRRRLLVKPGVTGLWQVSGRSDLSWEESVRLDLRYVEDWSLALDVTILWKTLHAVLRRDGAY